MTNMSGPDGNIGKGCHKTVSLVPLATYLAVTKYVPPAAGVLLKKQLTKQLVMRVATNACQGFTTSMFMPLTMQTVAGLLLS